MALWMVRVGRNGEYESKFLSESRIYLTWDEISDDLSKADREKMKEIIARRSPEMTNPQIANNAGQLLAFAKHMSPGDWVILPSKKAPALHIAEIKGDYVNDPKAENPYFHYREVKWINANIPRSNFDQDILYSLGSLLTICRVRSNNAEERIEAMANNGWRAPHFNIAKTENNKAHPKQDVPNDDEAPMEQGMPDIEQLAKDQIAKFIGRNFKGHDLTYLIDEILKAQGYSTFVSPPGPDGGVDILAGRPPLGFGRPRLCVQVKSGDSPLERQILDQLIGAISKFGAGQGLLVSWGGFRRSINKELPRVFFRVRLWDQGTIIEELFQHYDSLDEEIKAKIPLKRMWALALSEDA